MNCSPIQPAIRDIGATQIEVSQAGQLGNVAHSGVGYAARTPKPDNLEMFDGRKLFEHGVGQLTCRVNADRAVVFQVAKHRVP